MPQPWVRRALLVWGLALLPLTAAAQDYPSRTIRIIVPNPPGGAGDISARLIGQKLSDIFRQPRRLHHWRRHLARANHRPHPEQDRIL